MSEYVLCIILCFKGDHIWIEPVSDREFDVALGARVISKLGDNKTQVISWDCKIDNRCNNNIKVLNCLTP